MSTAATTPPTQPTVTMDHEASPSATTTTATTTTRAIITDDDTNKRKQEHQQPALDDNEKAHTFRKRRLSLNNLASIPLHDAHHPHRRRSSVDSIASSNVNDNEKIVTKTVHANELHSPNNHFVDTSPPSCHSATSEQNHPKWKRRLTIDHKKESHKLPFPPHIVGTYSCHGVEPIYESDDSGSDDEKVCVVAKINQDRGGVACPYANHPKTALFAVYDGHGAGGELISQYCLTEMQRKLETHAQFHTHTATALTETFLEIDAALKSEALIDPFFAGTTACVVLLRDTKLYVANAGDSRVVLCRQSSSSSKDDTKLTAIPLSIDQNPHNPDEQRRIEQMGGHVTPPPQPGLSSRVWLDPECTQIGLAMSRSIGDHAIASVGVIAEPVVTEYEIDAKEDAFLILASDGVWEFIDNGTAVQIVSTKIQESATLACQTLIEEAAERWKLEEGDYRDDITCLVVNLQRLWETKNDDDNDKTAPSGNDTA